ncbi:MAG: hypothetical protein ACTSWC_08840, partial [Promethearchaeota archaeon]
ISRLEMGNLYFIPLFVILSLLYAILAPFIGLLDGILYIQFVIIQILMIYGPLKLSSIIANLFTSLSLLTLE